MEERHAGRAAGHSQPPHRFSARQFRLSGRRQRDGYAQGPLGQHRRRLGDEERLARPMEF